MPTGVNVQIIFTQSKNIIAILIILLIGLFHIFTLEEGHDWGGDFAHYIHHAKNIAEGNDYSSTGYIFNDSNLVLNPGPKTYPPIFPIILSPFYKFFGLDLKIMKMVVVLFFMSTLYMIYLVAEKYFRNQYAYVLIVIIGVHPFLWEYKENILSEIPFMFIIFLSFYLIDRFVNSTKLHDQTKVHSIILGILFYMAYGTRIVGIVLAMSFTIYYLIKFKKISTFLGYSLSIFTLFFIIQIITLPGDRNHFDLLINGKGDYLHNIIHFFKVNSLLFDTGYSPNLRRIFFLIFGSITLFGFISKIKYRFSVLEVFYLTYSIVIILWSVSPNTRLLAPVVPLFFFYFLYGMIEIAQKLPKKYKWSFQSLMAALLIISYTFSYDNIELPKREEGVRSDDATEMFEFIKQNTSESDIFLFFKPRVLSLFANRQASYSSFYKSDIEFWRYAESINVTHIILGPNKSMELTNIVRKEEKNLINQFSNKSFKIFEILSYPKPNAR